MVLHHIELNEESELFSIQVQQCTCSQQQRGTTFLLYFIQPQSSMALQPPTSEVNNDNLMTTAPVRQQMKSCFLKLGRWENGQAQKSEGVRKYDAKRTCPIQNGQQKPKLKKKGQPVSQGLRKTWYQYAQREEGKMGEGRVILWGILGPVIFVNVTLTCPTYLIIVAEHSAALH